MKNFNVRRHLLCFLTLTISIARCGNEYCFQYGNRPYSTNNYIILKEIRQCGYLQCIRECYFERKCVDIVYRKADLYCSLITRSYELYNFTVANFNKELVLGPCAQQICGINDTCVPLSSGTGVCIEEVTTCPSDWVMFQSNCYFFSNEKRSWNEAKVQCETKGGSLVSVSTEEIKNFLHNKASALLHEFWTGAVKNNAGDWTWTANNKAVTFPLWLSVSLSNSDNADCLRLHPIGILFDMHCTQLYRYICQNY